MSEQSSTNVNDIHNQSIVLGELDDTLGYLFKIAQLKDYEKFFSRLSGTPVRPGQYSVLYLIQSNPRIRQGLLARELRIKPAHMTKLIRACEDQLLVQRHIPDQDRRAVELSLTDTGEEFVNSNRGIFFDSQELPISGLTTSEGQMLKKLLRKFIDSNSVGESDEL